GAMAQLHITPKKATVIVDGADVGQARDFSSPDEPLVLAPGTHVLEFSYDGYKSLKVRVEAVDGKTLTLQYDLEKGEGVDPRSEQTETPPPQAEAPSSGSSAPLTNLYKQGWDDSHAQAPPNQPPAGTLRTGKLRIHVEPEDAAV